MNQSEHAKCIIRGLKFINDDIQQVHHVIVIHVATDEIQGTKIFLCLKIIFFTVCSEDIIFIFHMLGYRCRHGKTINQ